MKMYQKFYIVFSIVPFFCFAIDAAYPSEVALRGGGHAIDHTQSHVNTQHNNLGHRSGNMQYSQHFDNHNFNNRNFDNRNFNNRNYQGSINRNFDNYNRGYDYGYGYGNVYGVDPNYVGPNYYGYPPAAPQTLSEQQRELQESNPFKR